MEFLVIGILGIGAWLYLRAQSPNDAQTPQAVQANHDKLVVLCTAMISGGCPTYDQIKQFQHLWNLVSGNPQLRLGETGIWDAPTQNAFAMLTGVDLSPCFTGGGGGGSVQAQGGMPLYPMSGSPPTPYSSPMIPPGGIPINGATSPTSYQSPNQPRNDGTTQTAPAPNQPLKQSAPSAAQPVPVQIAQPISFIRMNR